MTKKQKKMLMRIIVSSVLLVVFAFIPVEGLFRFALYLVPYFVIGYDILRKAFIGIKNRRPFDESFLMAVATIGAIVLAVYTKSGDYTEAVAVMLFYQIGELFQSIAIGKSRKNISELMDIRPDYANVEIDGKLVETDPDEIEIGTVITVKPGEKVPLDGIVVEGNTAVNTSALTGESRPIDLSEGDEVLSGCINMSGLIKVKTTKEFVDSTVSKILELVENASSRKSKSENFISRFARVYTPVVCIGALVLAFVVPLLGILFNFDAPFSDWVYRALTFLVISCPCALVISIPLSFFAGIGGSSREGILIKGSNYMETLSKVKCVVFDKTGTLTEGVFEVTDIKSEGITEEKLLFYAACAESASSHPISRSICDAAGFEPDMAKVSDIHEQSGKGVSASVDGITVASGNDKLMKELGIEVETSDVQGTVVYVALDGKYAGRIVISDKIKETAKSAVKQLKKAGVKKTVMLTGDSFDAASKVVNELGIDEFYSGLLPSDKVDKVESLLQELSQGEKLAFAGDGINDAPVLTRADVGIAMGALGSDAAVEAADVVLMDDNPAKIAKAVRISRKCLAIVYENIWFAIGVKLICLALGTAGIANLWMAIFADVGVMILAVINAMRTLFVRKL